jgi:hypothetical protein
MDDATDQALELRRAPEQPPNAIRLPAETPLPPAELPPEEVEPRPTAEQISKNEFRLLQEAKNAPAPDQLLETAPMLKPSLVAPVQLNGKIFQAFLDALSSVARESAEVPILRNVRMTYDEGMLRLEATDNRVWAITKMKASGGRDGFECVLPLKRARNVVRRMVASYATVAIGVDAESIHIGNYSLPHGGSIRDYPQRMTLLQEELKAALPAHYIGGILKRLAAVIERDHDKPNLRGVHLDFNAGVAVATDGKRLHMLGLPEVQIATRNQYRTRPSGHADD